LANLLRGTNLNEVKDLAESEGFRDLCNKLSLTEITDACDMYLEKDDGKNAIILSGHDKTEINRNFEKWKTIYDATSQFLGESFSLGEKFQDKQAIFVVSSLALRRCQLYNEELKQSLAGDAEFREYLMIENMIAQRIFALDYDNRT
jgi:hypothetical protein